MAWIWVDDTFINLDHIILIEFKKVETGVRVEFWKETDAPFAVWVLSEGDAVTLQNMIHSMVRPRRFFGRALREPTQQRKDER